MQALDLREVQLSELEILKEFDKICSENDLRYSLAGGTLLGAIRHKGFIPWDDDIDVFMPRPDYEKLIEIFRNSKFETLYISGDSEKNAEYPFIKLMDKNVEIFEEGFKEVKNLWIDIFPSDGFPEEISKSRKVLKKARFYRQIIRFSKIESFKGYNGHYGKFAVIIGKFAASIYGYKRAIKNLTKLALKNRYEDHNYVGCVVWGLYGIGERIIKEEYENLIDVEFEGYKFKAMSCWDSYLNGIYGDYMTLPPEDKRVVHGFKAYRIEK